MSAKILRVAVPSPLYRSFDYRAPPSPKVVPLCAGMRVRVPFGRAQQVGIILEVREDSPLPAAALRSVLEVLDAEPILSPDLLYLARWAQRYYHHPPGEVLAALLPTLLRQGQVARRENETLWAISAAGRTALADAALQRAPRQRAVLEYLATCPTAVNGEQLRRKVPGWSSTIRALRDKGWAELSQPPLPSPPAVQAPPVLNPSQATAVTAVCAQLEGFHAFLLDGVTGSGKTEVYLRIAEAVLALGRQALVLVPEIGLTPQLLARFQARLAGPLAVLHSGLSDRERLNAWLMARDGSAPVIIGTRSAIFTPLKHPGVIIIDEEHDGSFKQQEGFRYNARNLAVVRARRAGIPVLLGSATPSLESLHNALHGRYRALYLPQRVGNATEPRIELLDVRRQAMQEGLSAPLLARMRQHLGHDGQVLLFLNRRGFAPTLICHECGWLSQCSRCDARMTLHLRRRLVCHHCGAQRMVDVACPDCGSVDLRALGQGTERIEQVLERDFPGVGIARLDRDNTRRKGSLQALLEEIHSGERRILIGTQMLAKGHHFPEVTLVGIVDADQGLFGVDFRAGERMAQLILQVAGRAGRADKPGLVVIQTHHPEHPLLRSLVSRGYPAFAAATLEERRVALLPPFSCQALLRAEAAQPALPFAFLDEALELGRAQGIQDVELLGPIPAPMERRAGRYRAQLLAQAERRTRLHAFLDHWVERLADLKTARKVRWSLDVDPQDLL